jgi:uncharacterized membrane protein YbhN (UPF0104 family)
VGPLFRRVWTKSKLPGYRLTIHLFILTANYKSYLNWLIKIAVIILSVVFIWRKLNHNKNLAHFPQLIQGLNTAYMVWAIIMITLLMLLNWLAEAYKWQLQLADIAPISLWSSIQAIFCGITVGIITPNRIGDYGTRVLFLRPRARVYGLIAVGIGGLAQFIVINMIAAIAVCTFLYQYKAVSAPLVIGIGCCFALYCALLLLLLFNMAVIRRLMDKINFLSRFKKSLHMLSTYNNALLIKILLIGLFRALLLVVQYYIIIHLLIPPVTFWQIALMITLLISFQTVVPTIGILDIGIRGFIFSVL